MYFIFLGNIVSEGLLQQNAVDFSITLSSCLFRNVPAEL